VRAVGWDIEATSLLDESSIDYTSVPYKLKDSFKIHCIVCTDKNTGEVFRFVQDEVFTAFVKFVDEVDHFISHNGINYDHLALKLYLGMDYEVDPDTFMGRSIIIDDTMVLSKTLNADRKGGHSLDSWGKRLNFHKTNWRAEAIELGLIKAHSPKGAEFAVYHPRMLAYCEQDVAVTLKTYDALRKEQGSWNFDDAYQLEKAVAEIITRQEHRGFWFDSELAQSNLEELDALMLETKIKVEPYIPMKTPTKFAQKEFTPPKAQFIKSGQLSSHMIKFVERLGAEVVYEDELPCKFNYNGEEYNLPLAEGVSLLGKVPASIDDNTHIKEWLVEQSWRPSEYSEKDLTCDTKKNKLSQEKFEIAATRYIDQTLSSVFCRDRLEWLNVNEHRLKAKILGHDIKKPLKVLVNPKLTIGTEKEIDPNLLKLGETFPHAKSLAEYYTYKHRRSSILGGGMDFEDSDDAEKGYFSYLRPDNRIPTPADTCGCNTTRFKHRKTANIPRSTSLFGAKMRGMFGVDTSYAYQLGYDFDSLEAKIEAAYTYKYEGGKEYGEKLIAAKPNDFHTTFAAELTELVGRPVSRGEAKGGVKYGLTYGSQPPRLAKSTGWPLNTAKMVFDLFWERASPLRDLKVKLEKYWETTGGKQFVLGLDGRKIYTRSKHSLLNALFQSAGVICAKRAMVIHDRKIKQGGLHIDFFKG
jgi:hypothetical protein